MNIESDFWTLVFVSIIFAITLFWLFALMLRLQSQLKIRKFSKGRLQPTKIQIKEHSIAYTDIGKGQPILLIHGLGASQYSWRLLAPILAQKYRVIAIDLPGFGYSSKSYQENWNLDKYSDVINSVLRKLQVSTPHIVGSSLGGLIALKMIERWPEQFRKVAAISPPLSKRLIPFSLSRLQVLWPVAGRMITTQFVRELMKRTVEDKSLINEESIGYYSRAFVDEPESFKSFIQATEAIRTGDNPNFIKNISSPVLFLWGAKDRVVPIRLLDKARQMSPESQYFVHEKAGHHMMEDQPEWVASRIQCFFES